MGTGVGGDDGHREAESGVAPARWKVGAVAPPRWKIWSAPGDDRREGDGGKSVTVEGKVTKSHQQISIA
jgi:hypothetical protein